MNPQATQSDPQPNLVPSSLHTEETKGLHKKLFKRSVTKSLMNFARMQIVKRILDKEKYTIELLPEEEKLVAVQVSTVRDPFDNSKSRNGRIIGKGERMVIVRCSTCLDPATKVERYKYDATYRRPLCDACSSR